MDLNPSQHDEEDGRLAAGDLLVGAQPIEAFLISLGMPNPDAYYLRRSAKMPIGKFGAHLVASKRKLALHVEKLTAPPTS
jgi:hypothetical protein